MSGSAALTIIANGKRAVGARGHWFLMPPQYKEPRSGDTTGQLCRSYAALFLLLWIYDTRAARTYRLHGSITLWAAMQPICRYTAGSLAAPLSSPFTLFTLHFSQKKFSGLSFNTTEGGDGHIINQLEKETLGVRESGAMSQFAHILILICVKYNR